MSSDKTGGDCLQSPYTADRPVLLSLSLEPMEKPWQERPS